MSVTASCFIISQYAPAVQASVYTSPSNTVTIIDKFTVTNSSVSTATISISLLPSGKSADSSNLIIDALSVSSGATIDITSLQNQILNKGEAVSVIASAGSAIVIRASGRVVT